MLLRSNASFTCVSAAALLLLVFASGFARAGDPFVYNNQPVQGLAAEHPGDVGIEDHAAVLFAEMFEGDAIEQVAQRWDWTRGDKRMLDIDSTVAGPPGTEGENRLRMTIHRREGGSSADLRKILDDHYEQIHLRFYVRFAEDYGFYHHFTRLRGELNPTAGMRGAAGRRPEANFSAAIEHTQRNNNYYPARDHTTPPGYWSFYIYWPEMRSYENPDGTGSRFYGNRFTPNPPVASPRGEWECIEIMVRMNSTPDSKDGALGLWVDGVLVGLWDPKADEPVQGYWMRDTFRWDPEHDNTRDFPGFNWTTLSDPDDLANFKNVVQLHHYISGRTWENAEQWAEEHPDFPINLESATVWKDHVVVATEYIGPIAPRQ